MEAHDSDDEVCNSDDLYTDVSDDESVDPATIWGEDPDWAKESKKRSSECSGSVKSAQDSEKDESVSNIECSTCLEQIKSSNLASVDGRSHTFCCARIETWLEKKNTRHCCRIECHLMKCVEKETTKLKFHLIWCN